MTDTPSQTTQTYRVVAPKRAVPTIQARAEKLNDLLDRKGIPGRVTVTVEDPEQAVVKLTATGQFRLGSWDLIGTYHFQDGTRKFTAPLRWGFPDGYRHPTNLASTRRCDHCKTERYRNSTFVVQHDDGRQRIVGSTCILDYTGHKPSDVLYFREVVEELASTEDWLTNGHAIEAYETFEVMTYAVAAIRRFGYSKSESTNPTKWRVLHALRGEDGQNGEAPLEVTPEDVAAAAEALTWALMIDLDTEFEANMRSIATNEFVTRSSVGVAAFIPEAFRRTFEKAARAALPKAPTPTGDGPFRIVGTVTKIRWQETQYGSTLKATVRSDDGYLVWGTVPSKIEVREGDRVEFRVSSITRSDRDPSFGFFKRPRRWVTLIEE